MKQMKRTCISILLALAMLVPTMVSAMEAKGEIESVEVYTNKMLFENLEKAGYNVHDFLTDEEIADALAADYDRSAGVTKVVHYKDGRYDIYLSASALNLIKSAGLTAVGLKVPSTILRLLVKVIGNFLDFKNGIIIHMLQTEGGNPGGMEYVPPQTMYLGWDWQ